ncbi:MAG: hypothetical protein BroJett030_32790 [Alphaproteobacteria bacterium]|nr:MAG: hypothetical protein BroJett030_32790 [Alphaproteobacteria bacterium]
MRSTIVKFAAAAGAAALVASSLATSAHATHQWGHFVAGVAIGTLLARPYVAAPPGPGYVVTPAPVYVQPRVCYRKEKYYDPYAGWLWRDVQYYC